MPPKRENTAIQKATSNELQKASQEKLEQLDIRAAELKELTLKGTDNPFVTSIAVATTLQEIRELMSDKMIMGGIMALQGTKLGFVTDRDKPKKGPKGYDLEIVRDVTIEAASKGARMIDNEVNIISGACYLTKAYFRRMLDEKLGKGKWHTNHEVPQVIRNKQGGQEGAKVTTTIKWEDSSGEKEETVTHAVKGNDYSTADAYLGKADRKCGKWLLENITGERFNDGDADEIIEIQAQSVPVEEADTTVNEPASEDQINWIKFLCSRAPMIEEDTAIGFQQEMAEAHITNKRASQMHNKMVVLFREKGIKVPTKTDFVNAQKGTKAPATKKDEGPKDFDRDFYMRTYHALGNEMHGDDWDRCRKNLVDTVSPGKTSSKDLTDQELIEAIERLKARKANQ
jgi:hypothetical protein